MAHLKPSEHCTPEEPASLQLHRQGDPRRTQLCLPHWHLLWLPHGKLTPAPPIHSCIHPLTPCLNYYDGFHARAMQQWNPFCKLAQLMGCWSGLHPTGLVAVLFFFFFPAASSAWMATKTVLTSTAARSLRVPCSPELWVQLRAVEFLPFLC